MCLCMKKDISEKPSNTGQAVGGGSGHGDHDSHAGHFHSHAAAIDHLNRAFILGIALNVVYVAVELVAGIILNSVSLVSDAGHNLSDVVSLVLALLAFRLAKMKPTQKYTYGYKKSTILISLLNACILLVAVGIILWESIQKIRDPHPVEGGAIAWVAGVGIVINAFTAWLFMKDRKRDLNVKGAFLHMAADALVSLGVVVSGIVISFTGWYIIDPIIGIVIAVVILISTTRLLFDSLRLSLDGVPLGIIAPDKVRDRIMENVPSVKDVHHIHIWAISTTENALTAHIVISSAPEEGEAKEAVKSELEHLGITHSTLEFEYPGGNCCIPGDCGCRD